MTAAIHESLLQRLQALPSPNGAAPPSSKPPIVVEPAPAAPLGFPSMPLATPTIVAGLGTTGSRAARGFAQRIKTEFGAVPSGVVNYLCIDADHPAAGDLNTIHIGVDGAGTNAEIGRDLFIKRDDTIREAVTALFGKLIKGEPGWTAAKSPNEVTTLGIVAGSGGTSGGCLDPMIDLGHDVARRLGIRELRIHVTIVGPEMSINDVEHSTTDVQRDRILANYAENLEKLYAELWHQRRRIFSLTLLDQSSEERTITSTNELTEMLGDLLFLNFCTPVGLHFAARACDFFGCGFTDGPSF